MTDAGLPNAFRQRDSHHKQCGLNSQVQQRAGFGSTGADASWESKGAAVKSEPGGQVLIQIVCFIALPRRPVCSDPTCKHAHEYKAGSFPVEADFQLIQMEKKTRCINTVTTCQDSFI